MIFIWLEILIVIKCFSLRFAANRRNSMSNNKMKSTRNHKKEDESFHSKKIKHDPRAESARAVFGLHKRQEDENDMKNYSE